MITASMFIYNIDSSVSWLVHYDGYLFYPNYQL